jgi:hypothetical protein
LERGGTGARGRLDAFDLSARWFAALFVLVQAASLYPIAAHRIPSVNDLQNHLARVWILVHDGDEPALQRFYRVDWHLLPNLAIDGFGVVVARFASLDVTGKLFLAATFVLLLSGVAHLHRALFARWSAWPLLAAFFLYNRPLLFGFAGFLAGVGLYLHAVAVWVELRQRHKVLRIATASVLALVIFFAHLFALGLLGLTLVGLEAVRAARERWDWRRALGNAALLGLPFVAPLLVFLLLTPHGHAETALSYRGLMARVKAFGAPLCYDAERDALLMAAGAGVMALIAVRAKLRIDAGLAAGAGLLVAAQFAMPNGIFTALGADHRIPIALCFLALAGSDLSAAPRRMQGLFAAALAALIGARVWTIDAAWASFDPVYADVQSVLRALPPGAVVATAYPHSSFDSSTAPAIAAFYLPLRWAVERGGFSQTLFAVATQNPVTLKPPYRALAEAWPAAAVWERFVGGAVATQRRRDLLRRFDAVVFVTDGGPFHVPPTPLLSPLKLGRWAAAYRVVK